MIPLIPTLILAFVSFIASAFIVLRIVIPILPPHPLSKRVSPAEFGLPTFRSLSPADKSHLWLASLDLIALILFIWETVNESTSGLSGFALATDPGSAVRLWIVVTIRQTCLLFVAAITLLHVRMANSVSFGSRHWMLWGPTALFVITSTAVAGVLSGSGVNTLFYGMTAYTAAIAVLSSIAFGYLVKTLFAIKKNLAAINETNDVWPPMREGEEKPRPSFATEDIDAIRDGASWITSNPSSRRNSASAWSFSTHHTMTTSQHHGRPQTATHPSVPAKSSFWFGSTTANDIQVPPVPPLPSPYGPLSPTMADPDPFRKDPPTPRHQKMRMGSQSSWLTSSNGSHTTITSWSYPTTHHSHYEGTIHEETTTRNNSPQEFHAVPTSRPMTPAMADAQVLGGYGYAEKGLTTFTSPPGTTIEISMIPAIGWSVMIWIPLAFALPYFITLAQNTTPSTILQILFVLSVTLSSPLLALNLVCGSPLPIPVGIFDSADNLTGLPADPNRPMIHGSFPPHQFTHEYKRSTSCSVTVVEPRRSGDVWLSKGNAVDGKGKIGRAVGLLSTTPKLSVLPPEENYDVVENPPVPYGADDSSIPFHVGGTPRSEMSAQFGRLRSHSTKSSSHNSGADENIQFATQIMIAQRHYSALAQTVVVPGGSTNSGPNSASSNTDNHNHNRDSAGAQTLVGTATGAASKRNSHASHLRSRSVTSVSSAHPPTQAAQEHYNPSPPPSFPLPPTPPSVRAARLRMLAHKKSFSSGFSLGHAAELDGELDGEMNEIDALTAGVLPLLVPGLKVGGEMKIKKGDYTPPSSLSKAKGRKAAAVKKLAEFGEDFSSPEVHSTPARRRNPRGRKESGHKKNHFSLPSLSIGREGMQSLATWSADIRHALENKVGQYTAVPTNVDLGRRNTIVGVETAADIVDQRPLRSVQEEVEQQMSRGLSRALSTRSMGLRADVPHDVDTARSSMVTLSNMNNIPPSAASTVTLFEDFEAGMQSGPQAESTPHNSVSQKPVSRHPPPPMPDYRRTSGIRYIKSDNTPTTQNQHAPYPIEETQEYREAEQAVSTLASIAQWSSRAVRPLIPKASKLQRTPSESTSPKEGLRTLTLLQDRGNVVNAANSSPTSSETRPLTIGKAQKMRRVVPKTHSAHHDENAPASEPVSSSVGRTGSSKNKNLKSLSLVRSETAKKRGILRQNEVLPEVVVRPPSTVEHTGFVYSFRD
ncbi:hypothetical protein BDN70DRAFT_804846 [Pholiota conissans]|uniref:Uncharacterized protein n=1 Tax=Pholiota conissans TaxID=109636 RepID=A0A9P6CUL4_9AGAR|nr:hypothetical protein BDN70DRAFT_804846 [Pholiota conissans]